MPFEDRPLPDDLELPVINPQRKPRLYGPDNPPPGKGRPRGCVNKANRDLKNGLLTAAINLGRVDVDGQGGLIGYLEFLGVRYPKTFANLLGRLMPLQVSGNGLSGQTIGSVNVISVPVNHFLSSEAIAKLASHALEPAAAEPVEEPLPEPASHHEAAEDIAHPEAPEPPGEPVRARPVDGYAMRPPQIVRKFPKPNW